MPRPLLPAAALLLAVIVPATAPAQVIDRRALLERQTFWDNRDWDWYLANIPFLETPDADLDTTYYYRWELVTKHLTYGSPASGYSFTEFIDRPFWSGRYGAISCPAGHQLYEVRWLADPRYARDYARYWFRTEGAEPRRYSCWLADAVWAVHQVHPDRAFTTGLLPDLVRNYEGWERERFDPKIGLFWQTGHDDGMEININSRQTRDNVRGAPGYRPTLNSYLWADALAVARAADLAGDPETARAYRAKAAKLKDRVQSLLWDPKRRFFFHMFKNDEERDGFKVEAGSLTYQTGKFAGDPHGREAIGYVPWQFGLPDGGKGYEAGWGLVTDPEGFFAAFGPTVTERHDPQFLVTTTCCVWSGQSWPYATTQTLKAMANLLQSYEQNAVSRSDYMKTLGVYARTHRKGGRPYLAEGANPDTGSWQGYDSPGHSDHYFHSGFADLVVTGLAGLRPRDDDVVEIHPLAPEGWPYFALDGVPYRGRRLSVVWDRDGTRYTLGRGLHLLADGRHVATSERLGRLTADLPPAKEPEAPGPPAVNVAVNNDGGYFPRVTTSHPSPGPGLDALADGNFWYHVAPPNRWTFAGAPGRSGWVAVDFGTARRVDTVKLYLLDDGAGSPVRAPASFALESWDGSRWVEVPGQTRTPQRPEGHRANVVGFPALTTSRLRVMITHRAGAVTGLSEFEAWGDGSQTLDPAPMPAGNLAYNPGGRAFPKVSASHTSPYDRVERAVDGVIRFAANPNNRWTSFGSPNRSDWLEVDFGEPRSVGRLELALYDDRGGVQAPASYEVRAWDEASGAWRGVADARKTPETPAGGRINEVRFRPVTTRRVRVVFTHKGRARSGLTELLAWPE